MNKSIQKIAIITTCLWASTSLGQGFAHPNYPQGPYVSKQVRFWYKIFNKYKANQVVIHDSTQPEIIIDVIDFDVFSERYNKGIPYTNKQKSEITEKYKKRYYQAAERFKTLGQKAIKHGLIERRVFESYSKSQKNLQNLYTGKIKLRGQAGLKEEFERAADRSLQYMHKMEKIFKDHNIPKELTRIAFVESMFNERAISKVGASGIWQFMPSTAKEYLIVNQHIDERNSPIKATEAAAKLLKRNYKILKSWPLAITAYNYGAGGLLKAIKRKKTRDWNYIVKSHKSKTFGFASKNFYAEFLAAKYTYENKYARPKLAKIKSQTEKIKLPNGYRLKDIYKRLNISKKVLKKYNSCLTASAYRRYLYNPLPSNYEIIIPKYIKKRVLSALNSRNQIKYKRQHL